MSYCTLIPKLPPERRALHQAYHDLHHGFPLKDDNELFGRLLLEINQAGLSWETVLKKEVNFRKAYADFDIGRVAKFTAKDRKRLMSDAGIIRNRLKIEAAIENAKTILQLQKEDGSFLKWLEKQGSLTKAEWVLLFRRTFRFTGGEIVNEFLMSTGFLPGAHEKSCPIYTKVLKKNPAWSRLNKKK